MPAELIQDCFIRIDDSNSVYDKTTLYFHSMPDELSWSKQALIEDIQILGRSEPIKVYGSTGPRVWSIELHFWDNSGDPENEVLRNVNFLESLTHPIYKDGISYGLPKLIFCFTQALIVRTICSSVSPTWNAPWALDDAAPEFETPPTGGPLAPMHATVQVTLEQISDHPYGHEEVFNGSHNRGVSLSPNQPQARALVFQR